MEALFQEYPIIGIILICGVGILNTVLSVLSFKRTGVLKYISTIDKAALQQENVVKQVDVVTEDAIKLAEYHEKAAKELRQKIGGNK